MNPADISCHKFDVSTPVMTKIKELVNMSLPNQSIVEIILRDYNVHISSTTVKSFKTKELDSLFELVGKIPHGQDADRLIALMKSM